MTGNNADLVLDPAQPDIDRSPGRVVAIVGNPRPNSRTRDAALRLARRIAAPDGDPVMVDLAPLAGLLHDPTDERIVRVLAAVRTAEVLVVATPVFKASYTGLLKSFLDLFDRRGLVGLTAVPLTIAASAGHRLLADAHLRPVLLELGVELPTASVLLRESRLSELDDILDNWARRYLPVLTAAREVARSHSFGGGGA
jgi:FMN reductase